MTTVVSLGVARDVEAVACADSDVVCMLVRCSLRATARNIPSAISSFPTGVTCTSSIQMRESRASKIGVRE
jgi:hypothetical protein